jgi:membrane protease YdiL (CAAX protease family)
MHFSDIILDADGRIRSGWRFTIFVVGFIFLAAILATPVALLYPLSPTETPNGQAVYFILNNLAFLIAALVVGWLCIRFLDRLPFRALGASFTRGWFKNLVIGMAVGALTLCIAVGIAAAFGGLSFTTDQVDISSIGRTLGLSFAVFVVAGASEEAVFRGYPLQTFGHSNLKLFGIVFLAALFATTHVGNPQADVLSWINTFLAGIWFAAAYYKTGDLWLPFGMHLMWNWMQGAFFGIEVSGLSSITSTPLLKEIDHGPAWLTGETYGIEAGVATTAALVISTVAIYFWPKSGQRHEQ